MNQRSGILALVNGINHLNQWNPSILNKPTPPQLGNPPKRTPPWPPPRWGSQAAVRRGRRFWQNAKRRNPHGREIRKSHCESTHLCVYIYICMHIYQQVDPSRGGSIYGYMNLSVRLFTFTYTYCRWTKSCNSCKPCKTTTFIGICRGSNQKPGFRRSKWILSGHSVKSTYPAAFLTVECVNSLKGVNPAGWPPITHMCILGLFGNA